ncbi:MAG: hypothetical protein IPQ18_07890 [Saprospiraceae bacterium]|nr:hypothetical protein [Saprospiraceae bacterium]
MGVASWSQKFVEGVYWCSYADTSFQTCSSKDISFISIFAQNPARQGSEWSSQMSLEETEAM